MCDDPSLAPLDEELAAFAVAAKARALAPLRRVSVGEARRRVAAGNRLCGAGPDVLVEDHVLAVTDGSISLRTYQGNHATGHLVYLHGGGWITGDLDYSDEVCRYLAQALAVRVVSVGYRLAPEHPFPVPLDDAWAALVWVAGQLAPAQPLIVAGDSAGGNLAAACALRARDVGLPLALQLLIYPVLDTDTDSASYRTSANAFPLGKADMEYCLDLYLADAPRNASDAAPLIATSHVGLPSAVVVTAGHDPLRSEGLAYAAALRQAEVNVDCLDYPALCHGFLRFTQVSAAARAARDEMLRAARLALRGLAPEDS